jgi:hypothetical protein
MTHYWPHAAIVFLVTVAAYVAVTAPIGTTLFAAPLCLWTAFRLYQVI